MKGETAEHFFGSITYFQTESAFGQPNKLVLIDGQQRITTTMLFLVALRDILADENMRNFVDSKYLKNNNVHLHIDLMDEEIYLEADYNKLKQVFNNIIKNSIESSSKNIDISYRIMFGRVTIVIRDDGYKIDNDAIYKIGNYFTNKETGNGIGTSLIKKIISMHNGKIKYRNNKNKGVSVYITLTLS